MNEQESVFAVELENISKRYSSGFSLTGVNLRLKQGEIHALLGENGAGKSTLMNILFGLVKPDEGTIRIHGKEVDIRNPNDAAANGIGMVHQHFRQVESYTVLQNIVLGMEDRNGLTLDMGKSRQKVLELSEKFHFSIDPDARISDISVGMQQRVEILKMLYRNSDVLIFDEPTAVLTPQETDELLKLMKELAASGKCIFFISHKLNEIREVADRCSVIRKGAFIGTFEMSSITEEELSERMVGRKVKLVLDKTPVNPGRVILSVDKLRVRSRRAPKDAVRDVSFEVRAGEIVCIAGIDGNGQSELIYALTGLMPSESGKIILDGRDISGLNARERTLAGIAHIPEDRLKYGLVENSTIEENLILQSYYTDEFQRHSFLRFDRIKSFAERKISEFDISAAQRGAAIAGRLSGGNQQKVVIAREMARDPELMIAAQPIRGLDVGAIEFIHQKLLEARDAGRAVLLVSFELSEVMNLSDRILVMFNGEIVADLKPENTTTQELGLYMAGAGREKAE